ncbi:MAG: HAD-IB family phosphatase [Balneolaceae bacterium]|nr:HAD-IB family phosphatase [Balneolaceae bacterium]
MPWLLAYGLGIVSNEKAKNQLLDTFLRGKSTRTVDQASQFFLNEVLPGLLRPAALDRIADHRAAGHTLVLISASPDLYVKPWGVSHSFHHVICSSIRRDSRRITGGLEGRNCSGEVKAARLRSLIPDLDACHIIAYGDSEGDRQLLDLADESHYKPFQ